MTNLLCDSIDFATKFEEDRKSETCSVQFKQQIKTRILAGITLHKIISNFEHRTVTREVVSSTQTGPTCRVLKITEAQRLPL